MSKNFELYLVAFSIIVALSALSFYALNPSKVSEAGICNVIPLIVIPLIMIFIYYLKMRQKTV